MEGQAKLFYFCLQQVSLIKRESDVEPERCAGLTEMRFSIF